MNKINETKDPYISLMCGVLTQAIEDFQSLKQSRCIDSSLNVDHDFWVARGDGGHCKPKNFQKPHEAEDLVAFFKGESLDILCAIVEAPACRVRAKLGIPAA